MPVRIPFDSTSPLVAWTTTIDGALYAIRQRWNAREFAWYFDVSDSTRVMIRPGIKIVLDVPLGRDCVDPRFPLGIFIATDLSGADIEAGYGDLGTRVVVDYYSPAELAALFTPAELAAL